MSCRVGETRSQELSWIIPASPSAGPHGRTQPSLSTGGLRTHPPLSSTLDDPDRAANDSRPGWPTGLMGVNGLPGDVGSPIRGAQTPSRPVPARAASATNARARVLLPARPPSGSRWHVNFPRQQFVQGSPHRSLRVSTAEGTRQRTWRHRRMWHSLPPVPNQTKHLVNERALLGMARSISPQPRALC